MPIILYRGILFNGSIWVYGAYSVSFICDTCKIFLSFIMVSIMFMIQKSFYVSVPLDLCLKAPSSTHKPVQRRYSATSSLSAVLDGLSKCMYLHCEKFLQDKLNTP